MSAYKVKPFAASSFENKGNATTNSFPRMREMFKEVYNKRKIKDSVAKKPRKI